MFQVGDKVVYGIHGVCCVTGLEDKEIDRKKVTYLILEPAAQDGSRYMVPTHNAAAMGKLRGLLSAEELENLIASQEVQKDTWIQDENLRKKTYRELIGSGDRASLMAMVKTLYRHRKAQLSAGRKCHLCDENFLRDAEKLLASEVSIVMDMDPVQAKQFIRMKLEPAE